MFTVNIYVYNPLTRATPIRRATAKEQYTKGEGRAQKVRVIGKILCFVSAIISTVFFEQDSSHKNGLIYCNVLAEAVLFRKQSKQHGRYHTNLPEAAERPLNNFCRIRQVKGVCCSVALFPLCLVCLDARWNVALSGACRRSSCC